MATISASPEMVTPRPAGWIRPRRAPRSDVPTGPPAAEAAASSVPLAVPRHLLLLLAATFVATLLMSAVLPRVLPSTRPAGQMPATAAVPAESPARPAWTVQSGQTLWAIAASVEPDVDPRRTVERIRELNGLPAGHVLQVGEVLMLPTAG